ncbi:modulator of DNA gyrase family protein [Clostridium argentinense CDC 2741]|uniref:Modulator of DNA gyrase family protein n=1 Tax=Clostridium argentinense CDC 2741 TaxID=1418104 RepID=A0A0C1UGI9_9CLOT|nr:TldD/PmbA family protein [Clostridium argentinense]ARC86069.1 peptidase C69 [Clostridium argentinense]KIE46490.1 modulator of DNA gyrase family protein [Clostridium argentinense CDC 2741]NFF39009.1 TldD/PmbA family protein [Clostridium argentinense]NFP48801.1 TldD/PmbA family protein [Clostridium argentinense]NFP70931.1 TldD/PmbA family protein [Clostridium argentinense]
MKELIKEALDFLKSNGASYSDIRIVDRTKEYISTENLKVNNLENSRSKGIGIRVIYDGSLGFASSQNIEDIKKVAEKALRIAKASRTIQKEKINLSPKEVIVDHYSTPIKIDPFTVSKKEKIDLLFKAEEAMRSSGNLFKTNGSMQFQKEEKIFADTEGSYITQTLYESGAGIEAIAANDHDRQVRGYPASFGGNHGTAGYEFVTSLNLVENGNLIGKEAIMLLDAEECPSGVYDLVIDSSQMVLQIHESVGHPLELDRIFGSEAAYAGMSFVTTDKREKSFKYGSEHVTIVADGTLEQGLGTFGYDDDGVKAQKTVLIDKGILKNFLTSRDTAYKIGENSNGTNRADGWNNIPIVRMTNISLMPGKYEFDELLSEIDYGFYLSTNSSWSIDDKRINFQFGTEIAYEIKNGKLTGKIFKNPIYTGITPEFWGSCDGVCNEKYWKLYGLPNCGKGQPGQSAHVGHGSSPARFRNVKVGVKDVK